MFEGISVSVYKNVQIHGYYLKKLTESWVPFRQNIAKLLGGRSSIKKMNVQLEMKIGIICNIEILGQKT